jgi:phosphatidylinositol kinase/protein kinase (PI-3  family)
MNSKKKPLWLVFENADPIGENIIVMFKKGDDLRQDILTLQLFNIMNRVWFEEKIILKMSLYGVISTGYQQGMLEIVKESDTLATIHKHYGGPTAIIFSKQPLKRWMENNCNCCEADYISNFLFSCVAYCVSTFVLGIGDRHNDNIMIKKVLLFLFSEWRTISH